MTKYEVRLVDGENGEYVSFRYGTYDTYEEAREVANEQSMLNGCNAYVREVEE